MASEVGIKLLPEIITDILYRLPAKSVGRFRCVSKDWLSLLSSPQFIKTYQNTLNRNHFIFISNKLRLYEIPFHDHDEYLAQCIVLPFCYHEQLLRPKMILFETEHMDFTFHASCNGLVLASTHDYDCVHELVLFNPTTTEIVELSESGFDMLKEIRRIKYVYGFGYDFVTDDYKVVTISFFHNTAMYVHVYSLRAHAWMRVADFPYCHSYGMDLAGVFVNGFLHWIAKKKYDDYLLVIVAFSLGDECFSIVSSPSSCNDVDIVSKDDCKLFALGGKLTIFRDVSGEIWLMNEYGVKESWTKIIIHGFDELPKDIELMIFDDNGKIVMASNDRMWVYDIEERRFYENVKISQNHKLVVKGSYVESLVSPKLSRTN